MSQELKQKDLFEPEFQGISKHGREPSKFSGWFPAQHWFLLPIFLVIPALIFFFMAPALGTPAGTAIGSLDGVTKGIARGAADGEAAGLSAEDTTVKIATQMSQTGNLQVLLLDLQLSDLYTEGSQYAALFSLCGEGVFTVDLTQSHIIESPDTDTVIIEIPYPEFVHYLDDSTIETVAEYKAAIFNGSTKNGYTGWLNSRDQIDKKIQSEMIAYDALEEQAKNSAKKQVKQLAESVCGNVAAIEVRFTREE